MTTVYFAGGEDSDLVQVGGGVMNATGGRFRSAYARGSLQCQTTGGTNSQFWRNAVAFAASTFWFSGQHWVGGTTIVTGQHLWRALDVNNIVRLRLLLNSGGLTQSISVQKVDAAGAATQLGSNFTLVAASSTVEKLDIKVVYA